MDGYWRNWWRMYAFIVARHLRNGKAETGKTEKRGLRRGLRNGIVPKTAGRAGKRVNERASERV